MATDNNYSKEQYNVMSQFCDFAELQSSDEEGTNVIKSLNPNAPKHENKKINNAEIIHPTMPRNNNSKFDLSQFCDLTQLQSSDEDVPPSKTLSKPPPNSTKAPPKHSKLSSHPLEAKESRPTKAKNQATAIKKTAITATTNPLQPAAEHKMSEIKSNDALPDELDHANSICPYRKLLMFAMHLHLTGCIFPQWMVNVLTLFNDSNLSACHEGASLGKHQRKLFRDTVCNVAEPDNFIFVDTTKAIEINAKSSTDCSWAVVNVATENAKYCDLQSINGHKLNINMDKVGHLVINKGVYLFFNKKYQREFLNVFLYSKDKGNMFYFCREYKEQQKEHIAKILKLDYGVSGKYSSWFLNMYDRYLSHFDVNDCYELLAANIGFWKDLILNKKAMTIQSAVDHTFVVKTITHSKWIADTERGFCSHKGCKIKFNVVNRKHHCRCCGDIFCKLHCEKQLFRRNAKLESGGPATKRSFAATEASGNQRNDGMAEIAHALLRDKDLDKDERELRICPGCRTRKYLFVDVHHKHKFMECQCLEWSVKQIDFEKQWKIFKSTFDYEIQFK